MFAEKIDDGIHRRHGIAAEFADAALYVPFLAISALFSALSSFLGSVYVVKLRSGASLLTASVGVAVNLVLDFLLIPQWGAMGAVTATFASYAVIFLWRMVHCRRVMPFRLRLGRLTASTVLLFITAAVTVKGVWWLGVLFAALAVTPFLREIWESAVFFIIYGKKILRKSTKKHKLS